MDAFYFDIDNQTYVFYTVDYVNVVRNNSIYNPRMIYEYKMRECIRLLGKKLFLDSKLSQKSGLYLNRDTLDIFTCFDKFLDTPVNPNRTSVYVRKHNYSHYLMYDEDFAIDCYASTNVHNEEFLKRLVSDTGPVHLIGFNNYYKLSQ